MMTTDSETHDSQTPSVPGLTSKQMTWAWLLAQWVSFARQAMQLSDEGWEKNAKDSVPHLIQLQAIWHALGDIGDLPVSEQKLAVDRSAVLLEKHTQALRPIWEDSIPDSILETIQDAYLQWSRMSAFSQSKYETLAHIEEKDMVFAGPKPVIGLAGGIASGKSTVSRMLARMGCQIIDSDRIARSLLEREDIVAAIKSMFTEKVIDPEDSKRISRHRLGEIVFTDEKARQNLETLIHPGVHEQRLIERRLAFQDPTIAAVVEDCPLLFEKKIDESCDVVIYMQADRAIRLKRAIEQRKWTEAHFENRENAQLGLDIKAKRADYVVINDVSPEHSMLQVANILAEILCNFPQQ